MKCLRQHVRRAAKRAQTWEETSSRRDGTEVRNLARAHWKFRREGTCAEGLFVTSQKNFAVLILNAAWIALYTPQKPIHHTYTLYLPQNSCLVDVDVICDALERAFLLLFFYIARWLFGSSPSFQHPICWEEARSVHPVQKVQDLKVTSLRGGQWRN